MRKTAKIGLWFNKRSAEFLWRHGQDLFQLYLEEVLGHAGIPYARFDDAKALESYHPDIIVVLHAGEKEEDLNRLERWARQGATLISYGGLNRMAGRLGCTRFAIRDAVYGDLSGLKYAQGMPVLRAVISDPWMVSQTSDLPVEAGGVLRRLRKDGAEASAAVIKFPLGGGRLIRWNVDIPANIVMLQQGGGPVVHDGIPAPDGTGAVDEGILKADDRCELDWNEDRSVTETGMPYFDTPYADWWREVIVRQLMEEADALGLSLPFLDYWPEGVHQVAMISHDSDFNVEEAARTTLSVLRNNGVRSTWCMIDPGYSPSLYKEIQAAGHEMAFHFNALEQENGIWSVEEFTRQLNVIRSTSGSPIVSNKNHYTRFEGWGELYEWCELNGIEADQTRGPSKKGNVGFPFGTCHPYYPIARSHEQNRLYRVLQIGFLTQDLEHPTLSDLSVIAPFLEKVAEVRGVAHFLFHQQHIHNLEQVRRALSLSVETAKRLGYVFWTSEEITRWEQARRAAVLRVGADGILIAENLPQGAVVRQPLNEESAPSATRTEIRFGRPCAEAASSVKTAAE
ncbi:hypothetical protein [Paenibacillus sp. MDMC362]|uniref:hypothetical protein n=1 Tax=Paenibacillus sp. MDMC362 TaxID=2977365 RepID=UPI000DC54670|nr:hypothetical protein [Paenibacillus sp. MDMC362]RAR43805.1 hypothetical protein DP091_11025 [Paenibacillus sp. MDMC362]